MKVTSIAQRPECRIVLPADRSALSCAGSINDAGDSSGKVICGRLYP